MALGLKGAIARLALGFAALTITAGSAMALPSTKIGTAPLISPSAANTYYGSGTTSTNSTGEATRPKEVVELARALKGDPDLIYEYVRNNTEIVWTYGLSKGAMGVIVDRAGTSFDQAHLMVELLRQSGYTASFKLGTITLTGAQFSDWSGITSAQAACQLLSSGGIPAIINGTTTADCSYGSATVSSIELGHAWVSVTIGAAAFVYDPAYKPHSFKAGMNLATATGMTAGDTLTISSSTGTTSGVAYAQSFGASALKTKLDGYAAALDAAIAAGPSGAGMADVVGGQAITAQAIPAGGLRQVSLPYTSTVQKTITGNLPDGYRTSLRVQLTKARPSGSPPTVIDKTLFVDDIYGRKLVFEPNFDATGATFIGALNLVDEFGATVALASTGSYADDPTYSKGDITLTANLPYAAGSGAYMDAVVTRSLTYALQFTVVHGWGDTGRGLIDKWGSRKDSVYTDAYFDTSGTSTKGDGRRELLAAEWLAQSSKAARLHAAIAKSIYAQHYAIGVVSADMILYNYGVGYGTRTIESFDRLDVETGLSLTSKTASATDRRAAVQAIAATAAALKGSIVDQVADLPDTASTATRFAWANAPDQLYDETYGYLESGSSRPVYRYANATDAAQALALTKAENRTTASPDGTLAIAEVNQRRQAVADAVSAYVTAGFTVNASAESFIGPGERANGQGIPTLKRSGVITASRYDANGNPLEIANVVIGLGGATDSGGGAVGVDHNSTNDPMTAADVVKGRFVNGAPGSVTMASPVVAVVGKGELPYRLAGQYIWRDADRTAASTSAATHVEPPSGWFSNWSNSLTLSGSGLEAMGETDPRAAIGSIAAFYATQDAFKASPSVQRDVIGQLIGAWWAKSISDNVATISVGASVRQFVRKPSGAWFAPGAGSYVTLTQTGATSIYAGYPTRTRRYDGMSFALTGPQGDVQTFSSWSAASSVYLHGFHLTGWTWPSGVNLTFNYSSDTTSYVHSNIGTSQSIWFSGANITAGGMTVTVATPDAQTVTHTDGLGAVTKFKTATLGTGNFQHYRLQQVFAADDATNPASQYAYDSLGRPKENRDKLALAGGRAPSQVFLANGLRTETLNPLGYGSVSYSDDAGRPIRSINALGAVSTVTYDGLGRPISTTGPEGEVTQIEYNARNQPTKQTLYAKPGSAEAGQSLVTETGWDSTWNLPAWTKDPKGGQTDYSYTLGELTQTLYPAPNPGDARPTASNYYYASGLIMNLTKVLGQSVSMTYTDVSVDGVTNTVGSLSGAYPLTLNGAGDPTFLATPRNGQYRITYDALRRPTLQVEPQTGSNPRVATRTTYDLLGRTIKVEKGTYVDCGCGTPATFTPLETYLAEYDMVGNRVKDIGPAGVVQTSYDALNRVVCRAVRMNPQVYGSLPADACAPSTVGPNGPDRISRATYDAIGQVVQQESGVGTPLQQVTAKTVYSPSGLTAALIDSVGNKSTLEYDGFGRMVKLRYPASPRGSGASSTTDYEAYTYDVNGNRLSWRKRSGLVIGYQYDALNRLVFKDLPGTTTGDVYYKLLYDGAYVQARFGSATSPDYWERRYDKAGRLTYDSLPNVTAYRTDYDNEGNRVQVDTGSVKAQYAYDLSERLTGVTFTTSAITTPSSLETINYGALNRPSSIARPNGINTSFVFDQAGRLTSLAHAGDSTTLGFYQAFSYNPLGQLTGQSQAAAPYVWSGQPTTTTNFTHDQLNRDAAIVTASGYDADGNLISDGVRTFTYDAENRLTGVSGGAATVALTYDPWGRLNKIVSGGNTTYLGYNGSALLEERDGSLGLLRSYVHGPGGSSPLAWLEGATATPDVRWFHPDRLGSIIGVSSGGGTITPYTYGPYGEPQSWAGSRFRYTGQIAIPEAQLYHYNARAYDPIKGRFLQTDPIGYGDGMNIYAYVHGDPMNGTDPSGMSACGVGCAVVDEFVITASKLGGKVEPALQKAKTKYDEQSRLFWLGVSGGHDESGSDYVKGLGQEIFDCVANPACLPGMSSVLSEMLSGYRVTAAAVAELSAQASEYKLTATVAGHLDRPYINSPSLVNEIISTGKGVPDPQGLVGAVRYDVAGKLGTHVGTYELLINPETKIIYHFLFKTP